jgi:hypothetical protein
MASDGGSDPAEERGRVEASKLFVASWPQRVSSAEQVQYHDVCPGSPCVFEQNTGGRRERFHSIHSLFNIS